MKAAKMSHTVVFENPDRPQRMASEAGLKPALASCSGLK